MDKDRHKLLTTFLANMQISAFTFGGGFVIIPLMRKKFASDLGWIDEDEMLDLAAIAQSSPGPIAVNTAILIGYKVGKIPGALVSILGTVIPPFLIISLISGFYSIIRSNPYVGYVMAGTAAGVAAIVADVVVSMTIDLVKQKRIQPIIMLAAAFILIAVLDVSIVAVIILSALVGYASSVWNRRHQHDLS